jgi:hypothetical protein
MVFRGRPTVLRPRLASGTVPISFKSFPGWIAGDLESGRRKNLIRALIRIVSRRISSLRCLAKPRKALPLLVLPRSTLSLRTVSSVILAAPLRSRRTRELRIRMSISRSAPSAVARLRRIKHLSESRVGVCPVVRGPSKLRCYGRINSTGEQTRGSTRRTSKKHDSSNSTICGPIFAKPFHRRSFASEVLWLA